MSCTGCMYLVGKEAICDMTYACSGIKPDLVNIKTTKKSKKKSE